MFESEYRREDNQRHGVADALKELSLPRIYRTEKIIECSPYTNLPLCRTIVVNEESFDIASDWHLPGDNDLIERIVCSITAVRGSDVFICAGDVVDAGNGEDRSGVISQLLNRLASIYETVLYVPGNHCLRSREHPWSSFDFAENVLMPIGITPIVHNTAKNQILLGNFFYDFKFMDPAIVGFSEEELRDFYRSTSDGRYLLAGDVSLFDEMADSYARMLTPEVTLMVSHALPHRAPTYIKIADDNDLARAQAVSHGVSLCDDSHRLREAARYWRCTEEEARLFWNRKSCVMGSRILDHPVANPRDNLVAVYGHNHRGSEMEITAQNGSRVRLVTHQPYGGYPENWLQ